MRVVKDLPEQIDYSKFKWLRKGDGPILKDRLKKKGITISLSMIHKTLTKKSFNIDILTEAMKMVVEKQQTLLQLQAESDQLEAALKMKVA